MLLVSVADIIFICADKIKLAIKTLSKVNEISKFNNQYASDENIERYKNCLQGYHSDDGACNVPRQPLSRNDEPYAFLSTR